MLVWKQTLNKKLPLFEKSHAVLIERKEGLASSQQTFLHRTTDLIYFPKMYQETSTNVSWLAHGKVPCPIIEFYSIKADQDNSLLIHLIKITFLWHGIFPPGCWGHKVLNQHLASHRGATRLLHVTVLSKNRRGSSAASIQTLFTHFLFFLICNKDY